MRARTVLLSGLLTVAVVGCGDAARDIASRPSEATPVPATSAPTSAPPSAYVAQVNKLCAGLLADFLDVTTPHPGTTISIEDYNAEQPKVAALVEEFDASVAAIPITAADRPAADAFEAFRRLSDAADAELAAAAATGKQDLFDAAVAARQRTFESSSVSQDLGAAGIICNAR